ncbi:hypothetical protein FJU08_03970 [Martelella alba]|uniref:Uncharacterized protein n=1 Tax=Martelella alba TaxID=2590451 RepID=A0A506UH39_9HYPH|nr:hypothetical protein [Martelella alba]TPW32177.1 hypothetical protein FJU08_03970 [Martelella alba]
MTTSKDKADKALSPTEQRKAREAAKLKENLKRRKQQARARRAGEAESEGGIPAARDPDIK